METLQDLYSPIDHHFARFMERLAGQSDSKLRDAAARISRHTREGHICLYVGADFPTGPVVGKPGEFKPLILDDHGRLYLYRYWEYQEKLAEAIRQRVSASVSLDAGSMERLSAGLKRLFDQASGSEIDWQQLAAFAAITRRFCVISGGPGTGKTTTAAKILALMLELQATTRLKIALTAPTGKAAARLQEAISREIQWLNTPVKDAVPTEASTLHRLLGAIPEPPFFRHHEKNRISSDVVVVDEASMVDIAMMSRLVQAMPPSARLILLGDKDQLASVEAGAVLGDICDAGDMKGFSAQFIQAFHSVTGVRIPNAPTHSPLSDCLIQLQKNYRFGGNSGIRKISSAVNQGYAASELENLKQHRYSDSCLKPLPPASDLTKALRKAIIEGFAPYLNANDPRSALDRFGQFRILCALRQGPYGVTALNAVVETVLREKHLIGSGKWYSGRPVMITVNDYRLNLFNGDVGIALTDSESGELRVFFSDTDGSIRQFHSARLPEHETVYAMTVHKSQGSEFDSVLLILPDRDSPILTREILYTGITRAKSRIEIWGTDDIFCQAGSRRIQRESGLRDALVWH